MSYYFSKMLDAAFDDDAVKVKAAVVGDKLRTALEQP
jgi:hypothetical protein